MHESEKIELTSHRLRTTEREVSPGRDHWRWSIKASTLFWAVSSLFLMSTVLEGPIRYYLALASMAQLAYLPKVVLAAALVPLILRSANLTSSILVVVVIAASLLWGMLNLPSIQQVLFGVWVLVPLLYGLIAGRQALEGGPTYHRAFLALFFIATLGVFLSPFIPFAWSGSEVTIGERSIQVSRQWTSMGIDRHAGFARASYSAASQILVLSVLLMLGIRSRTMAIVLWMLAGGAIALTTAKGPVAAWALLSLFFVSGAILRNSKGWRTSWSSFLWGTSIVVIALPISTLLYLYSPESQGGSFLFSSFVERLAWMWPDSFSLLEHPTEWLFGRGVGGIGTAQQYFDPDNYLPADNIFVYLAVMLGPLLAITLIVLLARRTSSRFVRREAPVASFALVLCIMLYGLVANVIEDPFLAFFLGASIAALQPDQRRYEEGHA